MKSVVFLFSLFFTVFGIGIVVFTFDHFDKSNKLCSFPTSEALVSHLELNLWDQCMVKTYPFTMSNDKISCNCRVVNANMNLVNHDSLTNETYNYDSETENELNVKILESMVDKWDMLEVLFIKDVSPQIYLNLTEEYHYSSKYLRVLHLDNIVIGSLGEGIKNWRYLEYIFVSRTHWSKWPNNFEHLNDLSYLNLADVKYLQNLPPNLCSMTKLRALSVFSTWIGCM